MLFLCFLLQISSAFCRSMITYTWLLLSRWNNLTMWKWSRIEMVQILSIFSSWFLMLKLVDAALKASFILEDAANAADSSPDAPHCQHLSNIRCGFVCLALNFCFMFFFLHRNTLIFLDHIWYRLGYVRNSRLYGGFTRTYGHFGSPILEPPLDHTGNN